ncbi:MAG TPA: MBL fold metallo-hydrolase [Chitinophagaceae bacterium]|jgi:glyoxylase-like metal-dependent hydrolase (beta-lactamase superfamily II)|nr:MBL fold metallo-hydrolase [Chitinophagaceae bacterium]
MKKRLSSLLILHFFNNFFFFSICITCFSQNSSDSAITVRSITAGGVVYMLDCENGFGGGNVAASIGPDGILLVDDMYKATTPKVLDALKKRSNAAIKFVINTHFHRDHIEGNVVLSGSSTIIAHENVLKRFRAKPGAAPPEALPHLVFTDSLILRFNGEDVRLVHLPNGHTDSDVFVWFTKSNVIHMGDTYFKGMFPAVYKEGGGNILQLIANLEKIFAELPDDIKIIPGHGDLATKQDLKNYIVMLKETTGMVSSAIKAGKSLEQLQQQKPLAKYDSLGQGGAQTTEQYTAMLYKLLSQ